MVHALVGLASTLSVAQAERDDVVKWLVWRRADPEIRSGRLMKRAQDPGQVSKWKSTMDFQNDLTCKMVIPQNHPLI